MRTPTSDYEQERSQAARSNHNLTIPKVPLGQVRLEGLQPLTEPGAVREALARTSEGRRLLETLGRKPYRDLPDPAELLVTRSGARPVLFAAPPLGRYLVLPSEEETET